MSTAKSLSNAAGIAATYDLRPAGRILRKFVTYSLGIIVVFFVVMYAIASIANKKRERYEIAALQTAPFPAEIATQVQKTFKLMKTETFYDIGRYASIDPRNEEKARHLVEQIGTFCESSGRLYAARKPIAHYHLTFETETFKGLVRIGVRECVDGVVRGILDQSKRK